MPTAYKAVHIANTAAMKTIRILVIVISYIEITNQKNVSDSTHYYSPFSFPNLPEWS